MKTFFASMIGLSFFFIAASAMTQGSCIPVTTYRLDYQTVYEQRQVTAYRIEYETVCEERQVTSYKPVWETAVRENRYTVARPVAETAEREEYYTVQRPVYETAERDESYTVMKPVYETAYRTEYRTVYQPVTTCQTRYVDQGSYSNQIVLKPSAPSNRLTWQSAGCAVDPVTGQTVYQRGGLYWTQTQGGRYEVQKVWHPNVVAQQFQQTNYMPQTVAQQVPVQVVKYMPEQVVRKVPVQVCRMVTEQQVRRVPVTTYKIVYEERVEQVPYQVCRMVAEQQTIRVPRTVEKRVPVTYTYNVPHTICNRVPLDACGNPIVETCPGTSVINGVPNAPKREPTPAKPKSDADTKPGLNAGEDATPEAFDSKKGYGAQKQEDEMTPVPPRKNTDRSKSI